jgi:hypothetical protein
MRLLFLALAALAACSSAPAGSGGGGHGGAPAATGGSGGVVFVGSSSTGAGGCGHASFFPGTGCEGVAGGVTFSADVAPIFANCTGDVCHAVPTPAALVGKPAAECCDGRALVAPGDASRSYLVAKIRGEHLCAGKPMPRDLPPLAAADQATIVAWICEGAPDD